MENENITYVLVFEQQALKDIKTLKKSEKQAYIKLLKLLEELRCQPETGSEKPELLKHNYAGFYSRRISHKHRLIYSVNENEITITIISAKGHYDNK